MVLHHYFEQVIITKLAACELHAPHRNPVPPPKLAADAPVLNVRQPMVIDLRPALRMETHFPRERTRPACRVGRPAHHINWSSLPCVFPKDTWQGRPVY